MARGSRLLVLTCEHGGHRVPAPYAALFAGQRRILRGQRGWDPGALPLARRLARRFGAPLHAATVSRLVVDTNRSLHHRRLFSELTAGLAEPQRSALLERFYFPYRDAVEAAVAAGVRRGRPVLHVSVHSFAPSLGGVRRACDVGLLYDPRRRAERVFCARWQARLRARAPGLRVRRNHPYRGNADGLTTHLRRRFGAPAYRGIELEVSQAHLAPGRGRTIGKLLEESLAELLR